MATNNYPFSLSGITDTILKAIYVEDLEKVNEVIDTFVPPYLLPWEKGQPLISQAIISKRLNIAKVLIKRGCQIGDTVTGCLSLYPNAMLYGDVELVSLLLDKDPKSLSKNEHGITLLHLAVSESQESIVKLLLDRGVDINLPDSEGLVPANIAAKRGHFNILKMLLDAGACIESKTIDGRTNLLFAIEGGNINVVKLLLDFGANCNVKSNSGKTSLHSAIERGQTEITKMLVNAGADLNQRNVLGQTPLHAACMLNNRYLTGLLLDSGADVNAVDNFGMVPCSAFEKKKLSSFVFFDHSPVSFLLLKQLIILNEGGLYLNSKNKTIFDMFVKTYYDKESRSEVVTAIINRCEEEIHLMKEIKSNSITCYDILKKLNNPLNIATEAEISLLQSVLVENKFSLYTGILNAQLKYATLRNKLLTHAQEYFSNFIQHSTNKLPYIPDEVIRHILSLLNNYDLDLLIENIEELRTNHL